MSSCSRHSLLWPLSWRVATEPASEGCPQEGWHETSASRRLSMWAQSVQGSIAILVTASTCRTYQFTRHPQPVALLSATPHASRIDAIILWAAFPIQTQENIMKSSVYALSCLSISLWPSLLNKVNRYKATRGDPRWRTGRWACLNASNFCELTYPQCT